MKTLRRNLLIVRAGETSLHPTWLRGAARRDFDLLVSYYGTETDKYRDGADHYHVMAGPRWPAHDAICREQAALLAQYDYIAFACDDLEADAATWNKLFALAKHYGLDLTQPAVRGYVSYDVTRPRRGCILRYTNFVEVMCPVFSRPAMQTLSPTFGKSVSGWGLSVAWWHHMKAAGRVAILDAVHIRHGRPVGEGTLYGVLSKIGVNAGAELSALQQEYNSEDYVPSELSRVMRRPHDKIRKIFPWPYR